MTANDDARDPEGRLHELVVIAIMMAVASMLGCVPFFVTPEGLSRASIALASAVVGGVMLSASFNLIYEGQQFGGNLVALGIFVGMMLNRFVKRTLEPEITVVGKKSPPSSSLSMSGMDTEDSQQSSRRILMQTVALGIHSLCEGCGVGALFCHSHKQGMLIALALGIHNVAEGVASCQAFIEQGRQPVPATIRTVLVMLPQSFMTCVTFIFVMEAPALFPFICGFAAGSMLYLVFAEVIVHMVPSEGSDTTALAAVLSCAIFEACRIALIWVTDNPELAEHMSVALGWSLFAGLSTGIGGLLLLCMPEKMKAGTGAFLVGFAAGVMLVLSILDLILPNFELYGAQLGLAFVILGVAMVYVLDVLIARLNLSTNMLLDSSHNPPSLPSSSLTDTKAKQRKMKSALLITLALAAHNSPEGLAVGMTSLAHPSQTPFMAVAMAMHNIPEGLAVAAAIVEATGNRPRAAVIAALTGLVEPLSAVLSVAILNQFLTRRILDMSLLFVGGVMLAVSFKELLPQALGTRGLVLHGLSGVVLGTVIMGVGLFVFGGDSD